MVEAEGFTSSGAGNLNGGGLTPGNSLGGEPAPFGTGLDPRGTFTAGAAFAPDAVGVVGDTMRYDCC